MCPNSTYLHLFRASYLFILNNAFIMSVDMPAQQSTNQRGWQRQRVVTDWHVCPSCCPTLQSHTSQTSLDSLQQLRDTSSKLTAGITHTVTLCHSDWTWWSGYSVAFRSLLWNLKIFCGPPKPLLITRIDTWNWDDRTILCECGPPEIKCKLILH